MNVDWQQFSNDMQNMANQMQQMMPPQMFNQGPMQFHHHHHHHINQQNNHHHPNNVHSVNHPNPNQMYFHPQNHLNIAAQPHHQNMMNLPMNIGPIQQQQSFANQMNNFAQQITVYSQRMVQYGQHLSNQIMANPNNHNNQNSAIVLVDNGVQNVYIHQNVINPAFNQQNDAIIDLTNNDDEEEEQQINEEKESKEVEEEEFVPWNDEEVPNEFKCPISLEIMMDPVICSDGFYYERECIIDWLHHHNRSPMTNLIINNPTITTDHALKQKIKQWINTKWEQYNKDNQCVQKENTLNAIQNNQVQEINMNQNQNMSPSIHSKMF